MERLQTLIESYLEKLMKLIKRDWPYFLFILVIFAAGVLLGQRLWKLDPQLAKMVEKMAFEKFSGMAKQLENASFYMWILTIFANNMFASVIAIVIGVIFPLLPIFLLLGNGLLIGVFQRVVAQKGLSTASYYLALLPHGIFELTAFFIAVGLGIRLGMIPYRLFRHYLKSDASQSFFMDYFKELRYYAIFIFILLFIAAVFEVTISPALVK